MSPSLSELIAHHKAMIASDEQADTDRRMAEHFGIAVEDLDEYDSRIGTSIRDLALHNMEKWGEW